MTTAPSLASLDLEEKKTLQACVGSDHVFSQKKSTKIFSFSDSNLYMETVACTGFCEHQLWKI